MCDKGIYGYTYTHVFCMHVCNMCMYVHTYILVCTCICAYIYTYICMSNMCNYGHTYTKVCPCMLAYVQVYLYAHVCIYMDGCMYVCNMYIYV